MKRYIKTIALFGVVFLCLTILQKKTSDIKSHPFWGRNKAIEKYEFIKSNRDMFEMFFIGSSKTHNHINPKIIDRVLDIKSFNFGLGGVLNPEKWYIAEQLINNFPEAKKPKYIVIELQEIRRTKRLATTEFKYFLDYKRMAIAVKYFLKKDQYDNVKLFLTRFIQNQFNLGLISDQVVSKHSQSRKKEKRKKRWRKRKLESSSGFHPLKGTSKTKVKSRKNLINSLQRIKKEHSQAYAMDNLSFSVETKKIYDELIIQCRNNEIIPIFILTPGSTSLIGLYRELKNVNKIDMSNPEGFPEFYNPDFHFDLIHLNSRGSKIYSRELAYRLAEIIDKKY